MTSAISRSSPAAAHTHGYAKPLKGDAPAEGFDALFASMAGAAALAIGPREEKPSGEGQSREDSGKTLQPDAAVAAKIDLPALEFDPQARVAANDIQKGSEVRAEASAERSHAAPAIAAEPPTNDEAGDARPRPAPRTVLSARGAAQEALVALIRAPGRPRQAPPEEAKAALPDAPIAKTEAAPAHAPQAQSSPAPGGVVLPGVEVLDAPPPNAGAKPSASSRAAADIARQRHYAMTSPSDPSRPATPDADSAPLAGATFETMIALRKADGATVDGGAARADVEIATPTASGGWVPNLPSASTAATAAASPLATTRTFDQAAWSAALAEQVASAAVAATRETSVRVEPDGLGPIEVRVRVEAERVDVRFAIEHPVTVTMVRAALPDLERLLAQSGMSLGQANVAQQNAGGREQAPARAASSSSRADSQDTSAVSAATEMHPRVRVGLLDDFV